MRKREQELLARERLESSPHFTQITDQMASHRKALHRIRINISRKRQSIASLSEKLQAREQEIANLALEEQEHVAQLDRVERQHEQARLKVLEQIQPAIRSASTVTRPGAGSRFLKSRA